VHSVINQNFISHKEYIGQCSKESSCLELRQRLSRAILPKRHSMVFSDESDKQMNGLMQTKGPEKRDA